MQQQQIRDALVLLARLVVGGTFIAHGVQKLTGMEGVAAGFAQMGIPLPTLAAWFTALVETLGGVSLMVGLFMPIMSLLLAFVMGGAIITAHLSAGFFASDGGFEYPLVLGVVSLALGWTESRFTVAAKRGSTAEARQHA